MMSDRDMTCYAYMSDRKYSTAAHSFQDFGSVYRSRKFTQILESIYADDASRSDQLLPPDKDHSLSWELDTKFCE